MKSWCYKYIAICSAVLILSTKIMVFEIANVGVVEIIRWSSSSKTGFIIWAIKYVIFGRSNDFLYSRVGAQNYNNLQRYSNAFGITIADNASVGTLRNISLK